MIGISKLYCGTVEESDALRYGRRSSDLPSHLLQFSKDKNPVVKRAQNLRSDAVKTIEDGVDQILGTMRVAPHSEIARLERKVNSLSRKVRQLENEAA